MDANVKAFQSLALSEEAKQKILWANGSRILGIDRQSTDSEGTRIA